MKKNKDSNENETNLKRIKIVNIDDDCRNNGAEITEILIDEFNILTEKK